MDAFIQAIGSFWEMLLSLIGSFFAALVGVLMRHGHEAVHSNTSLSWKKVLYDTPTILAMGIIGGGIGQWLHSAYNFPELFMWVLPASLGHLGPKIVDRIAEILEKKAGD